MNETPLRGVKVCFFGAYGTLFDFAEAAGVCRDVLGDRADKLTALWGRSNCSTRACEREGGPALPALVRVS